jgi:hypothetical protein
MNAPCPPSPPFPPNQNWQWNGSRWVCTASTGTIVIVKVFNASAPYTPSPGLQSLTVETIGGGGGGGATVGSAGGGVNANTAGGGGSGGYSRKTLAAPMVAGGVNVTIGQGGAGADLTSFSSSAGQPTTFGTLCTSNGGSGGGSAVNGGTWSGGAGALPGVGDIAFLGSAGESGTATQPPSTMELVVHGGLGGVVWGGSSPGADVGPGGSAPGNEGWPNTGAGGTGGAVYDAVPGAVGGNGGSGICIVTEYCWADAGDTGCGCGTTGGARVAAPAGWQGGFDD